MDDAFFLPYGAVPAAFSANNFADFLFVCRETGHFDDIFFTTDMPVRVKIQGKMVKCSERKLDLSEVSSIVCHIARGANGATEVLSQNMLDTAYEIMGKDANRGKRYRFRVHSSALRTKKGQGIRVIMRSIYPEPAHLKDMRVDDALKSHLVPPNGMVVVCGETGSGKSTLLGAIIRHIKEEIPDKYILTGESPVEGRYDTVEGTSTVIDQLEVGKDLPNYVEFMRSCLRSNPDIILVGESREKETIDAAILASISGHLLYTTLHADTIETAFRRMVSVFGEHEQNGRMADLMAAVRVIIVQRLLPKIGGGRVPCRSVLVVTDEVREKLLAVNKDTLLNEIKNIVVEHGIRMHEDALNLYKNNLINEKTLKWIKSGA